jgi:hypothetical protein
LFRSEYNLKAVNWGKLALWLVFLQALQFSPTTHHSTGAPYSPVKLSKGETAQLLLSHITNMMKYCTVKKINLDI